MRWEMTLAWVLVAHQDSQSKHQSLGERLWHGNLLDAFVSRTSRHSVYTMQRARAVAKAAGQTSRAQRVRPCRWVVQGYIAIEEKMTESKCKKLPRSLYCWRSVACFCLMLFKRSWAYVCMILVLNVQRSSPSVLRWRGGRSASSREWWAKCPSSEPRGCGCYPSYDQPHPAWLWQ